MADGPTSAGHRADPEAVAAREPVPAVLGYARGCGWADLAPFVRSLRSVFSGRVIVVVDRNPTLMAWLATHGVQIVVASPDGLGRRRVPVAAQYAAFAEILHVQRDITSVVATGVRNVVFQGDPFGFDAPRLSLYPKAGGGHALDRAFGSVPRRSRDPGPTLRQTLSACAAIGLVAGPAHEVARFCQSVTVLRAIPPMGLFDTRVSDRAAAEVVADLNLRGGEVCLHGRRVATLVRTRPCRLGLRQGLIVNPDFTASPIVLGYDQIDPISRYVQDRWGLPGRVFRRPRVWLSQYMMEVVRDAVDERTSRLFGAFRSVRGVGRSPYPRRRANPTFR